MSKSNFMKKINAELALFSGKHPENIQMWKDGDNTIIQLSNVGVRDPFINEIADLVKNTNLEDGLELFGMPVKCSYTSNSIVRFVGKSEEIIEFVKNNQLAIENAPGVTLPVKTVESVLKKVKDRVANSKTFKKIEKIIEESKSNSSNKIKVYVIKDPSMQNGDNNAYWVEWTVAAILEIDAGTTWGDVNLQQQIEDIVGYDRGYSMFGSFNVPLNKSDASDLARLGTFDDNNNLISLPPRFVLSDNVKVGDTIDSRDYHDNDLWSSWGYQVNDEEYQQSWTNQERNNALIIEDGSIITITR